MNKDKQYIVEFVKGLATKNYSKAEKSLQLAINEKIKNRIAENLTKSKR
jgi:hypothetical protein